MLSSCTQLHRLKMDECHGFTAASVLALSVHCQAMQMLDVTGCDNVPETSVKAAALVGDPGAPLAVFRSRARAWVSPLCVCGGGGEGTQPCSRSKI